MSALVKFAWRLFIALLLLGFVLADVWPMSAREQFAADVARDACSRRPAPTSCTSTDPRADLFSAWLRSVG